MKNLLVTLVLLASGSSAVAHDFWIQPSRYQVEPGSALPFTFQVGHGAQRQRWGSDRNRLIVLADFFNGERFDRRGDLSSGGPADLITRFPAPGMHIVALQSTYAYSDLPSIRFNDYAKLEGLTIPLVQRQRSGKIDSAGREKYSRRAKALIQVGRPTPANQRMATLPLGLKLEIVPERNPYALGPTRMLPLHVIYNGRRLARATVKLTSLEVDTRPLATAITDQSGRAEFQIPAIGNWLLNVVWSEPTTGDPRADFDTTFSSLTFGYDRIRGVPVP